MVRGKLSVRVWLSQRRCARPLGLAQLIAAAILIAASPASANPELQSSGKQVWSGADISSNVWLTYGGVTFAPWSGIHDEGFRFRAAGGYGQYQYTRSAETDDEYLDHGRATQFHAETYFAEFLVGYQKRYGELIAKGFVGVATISHDISPTDEETIAIGDETGIKGVIELWINMGENGWGSLDLSWASAHNTRAARGRLGYRIWPKLSVGLEAGINLDSQGECRVVAEADGACGYLDKDTGKRKFEQADMLDYARAGTFVRYEWGVSEASLSGGVLGDSFSGDDDVEISPYMTFNWLTQF